MTRDERGTEASPDPWQQLKDAVVRLIAAENHKRDAKVAVDRARAAVEDAHRAEVERLRNEATRLVDAERRRWYAAIGGDVEGLAPEVAVERLTQERDEWKAAHDALERVDLKTRERLRQAEAERDRFVREIEEANRAFDEIGAPRADDMGHFKLTGRCWALSNQWAAERDALKAWKDAAVDLAVVDCVYTAAHENDPRQCLMDIVQWEQRIALDPAVSAEARALRDTFKQERDALRIQNDQMRQELLDIGAALRDPADNLIDTTAQCITRLRTERDALRMALDAAVTARLDGTPSGDWNNRLRAERDALAAQIAELDQRIKTAAGWEARYQVELHQQADAIHELTTQVATLREALTRARSRIIGVTKGDGIGLAYEAVDILSAALAATEGGTK